MTEKLINNRALKSRRKSLRKNQTPAELRIWMRLRNKQFNGIKFFRQYSVGNYILDFYSPQLKLAIEIDGGQHNEERMVNYDTERSEFLKNKRIKVIRFWNNEVLNQLPEVLTVIENQIITPPDLLLS